MGPAGLLRDLVVVMGSCLLAVSLLGRLRVPSVVAFLLAGILIGPGGAGLVTSQASIEQLAEVGVVFLLFSVGLQFSISELMRLKSYVLVGGGLQMLGTVVLVALPAWLLGMPIHQATFLGYMVAQTSTTVLLRVLGERGEVEAPHGRYGVGVSIAQDLSVVPAILFLPMWAGSEAAVEGAWGTLLRTVGLLAAIFVAARFLFPWFLERVVHTRNREAFTLATLLGALGTAWLCGQVGVSLSLGAFLAGIVLADSRYAHQVLSEITPLKDALASLFFASVGMLVAPSTWVEAPLLSLGLVTAAVLIKLLTGGLPALLLGLGRRGALLGGAGTAQVGEFSFVLVVVGGPVGLFASESRAQFLSVAVLSMALAPYLMRLLGAYVDRHPAGAPAAPPPDAAGPSVDDHVILVGYGVTGRNVVRVLRRHGVHHVVIELNPATVRRIHGEVERVEYGDATQEAVLVHAGVHAARALVVAIPDPAGARQIVAVARKLRPDLVILVRTRLVAEVDALRRLGAQDIVSEEFETSLELAGRVLAAYGVSDRVIAREKAEIRRERYALLLEGAPLPPQLEDLDTLLAEVDIATLAVPRGSVLEGRSLRELDLRRRFGVTVLACTRGGASTPNPSPDQRLAADDLLAVMGSTEQVQTVRRVLSGEEPFPGPVEGG